ncbi:hypothetical protein BN871_DS_00110 [Paenibacillus sp. P22]|nr:hypothetical protein BN871_DS_00110 [Paenibacillus sp. P22]
MPPLPAHQQPLDVFFIQHIANLDLHAEQLRDSLHSVPGARRKPHHIPGSDRVDLILEHEAAGPGQNRPHLFLALMQMVACVAARLQLHAPRQHRPVLRLGVIDRPAYSPSLLLVHGQPRLLAQHALDAARLALAGDENSVRACRHDDIAQADHMNRAAQLVDQMGVVGAFSDMSRPDHSAVHMADERLPAAQIMPRALIEKRRPAGAPLDDLLVEARLPQPAEILSPLPVRGQPIVAAHPLQHIAEAKGEHPAVPERPPGGSSLRLSADRASPRTFRQETRAAPCRPLPPPSSRARHASSAPERYSHIGWRDERERCRRERCPRPPAPAPAAAAAGDRRNRTLRTNRRAGRRRSHPGLPSARLRDRSMPAPRRHRCPACGSPR